MGTLKASESQATTAILNSTISAPSSPSTHLAVAGTQSSNSQLLVPSEEEFIESPALSIISSASDDGQKRSKAQNLKYDTAIFILNLFYFIKFYTHLLLFDLKMSV